VLAAILVIIDRLKVGRGLMAAHHGASTTPLIPRRSV
jgi:hypothetical protein